MVDMYHEKPYNYCYEISNKIKVKVKVTPSSKTPVRNLQCPKSMTSWMGVLDTFIFMLESLI